MFSIRSSTNGWSCFEENQLKCSFSRCTKLVKYTAVVVAGKKGFNKILCEGLKKKVHTIFSLDFRFIRTIISIHFIIWLFCFGLRVFQMHIPPIRTWKAPHTNHKGTDHKLCHCPESGAFYGLLNLDGGRNSLLLTT